jgi:murein DD-endopeptidase MepM/ murein hydrolase activator NlpD
MRSKTLLFIVRTRFGVRRLALGRGHLGAALGVVFVLALAAAIGGYYAGRGHSNAVLQGKVAELNADLAHQSRQLAHLRTKSRASIDAVAVRMADLDARVNRLDAMGKQVVGLAGLKSSGFDFAQEPGEGGPEPAIEKHWKLPDLGAAAHRLDQRIWHEQSELAALQAMLLHRKSTAETLPRGRPIGEGWISSGYGWRTDPFTGERSFHPGIDFAGHRGNPVRAVAGGVVTWAGPHFGYGRLVIVNDGNGYSTWYGHGEKVLVHVGQVVKRGEEIALIGSSGRSTGPHVHLEVHHDGKTINPYRFVKGYASRKDVAGIRH